MDTVVIIPAYNPDVRMYDLVVNIRGDELLNGAHLIRVLIVNDGSMAECESVFQKCTEVNVTVLNHHENRGKGEAIKTALRYISDNMKGSDYVGIVVADADGQHETGDIRRVINALDDNHDAFVLGSRKFEGKVPIKSRLGNLITKYIFELTTGRNVNDTQTGLRAFGSNMIPYFLNVCGSRYEYEMNELLAAAKDNMKIVEVPIKSIYINKNETSHFRPFADSFKIYREIIKFSASSLMSFVVDYVLFTVFCLITGGLIIPNIAARVISAAFNFTLNKRYVFNSDKDVASEAVRYVILAVSILVVNSILIELLAGQIGMNKFFAKIIVEMIMFVVSYVVQHKLIFRCRTAR